MTITQYKIVEFIKKHGSITPDAVYIVLEWPLIYSDNCRQYRFAAASLLSKISKTGHIKRDFRQTQCTYVLK